MVSRKSRGFTLIEMMIALSIFLIMSAIFLMNIQPALKQSRVSSAYNTTLGAMRQARDLSVAQRQIYFVTFNTAASPHNVTITQGSTGTVVATYPMPSDVGFNVVSGVPTSPTTPPTTPDGFGTASRSVDFDQGVAGGARNVVYFYPDGSAADAVGNVNNGVLYIARPADLNSSRAITLWGATGRLRGWRLYQNGGTTYYWRQQ